MQRWTGVLPHPAAARDAFDFGLDLDLDDVGQVIVEPLLEQGSEEFADHVLEGPQVVRHQE